jgi:hypothetical protein
VRFGESPDRLDRTLTLSGHAEGGLPSKVQFVPIRTGTNALYAQLVFADGTASETQKTAVEPMQRRFRAGRRLAADDSRAPLAFGTSKMGETALVAFPDAPAGSTAVEYAIDGGAFGPAKPYQGSSPRGMGVEIALPDGTRALDLRFRLGAGETLGPFRYRVEGEATLASGLEASFLEEIATAIECTRVEATLPPAEPAAGATRADHLQANKEIESLRSRLLSRGLSFVQQAPVVVCIPRGRARRPLADRGTWGAVRAVRVGASLETLQEPVAVRAGVASPTASRPTGHPVWHAFLPVDTREVVARFELQDGSWSEPVRVFVEPLPKT